MEFSGSKAIYIQISDLICENILLKKYKEGERIPSVREMAGNLEVNPNTIMRAFNYLQELEIIFNKRGIGYFIAEDGVERVLDHKKDNFLHNVLPQIFKECNLYRISMEEIKREYKKYTGDDNEEK